MKIYNESARKQPTDRSKFATDKSIELNCGVAAGPEGQYQP